MGGLPSFKVKLIKIALTQNSANNAWNQNMSTGNLNNNNKNNSYHARPVSALQNNSALS